MNRIADGAVIIQTASQSVLSTPSWFGEATLIVAHLRKQGALAALSERVRFARRRFGHYEVIDFLAVLFGYAISGERTLEAFYERLEPFAVALMAFVDRDQLPARSTLSRFLAALTQEPVEALRSLFLDDVLSRPLSHESARGDLLDREGGVRGVFDRAGTREAARGPCLRQKHCQRPFAGWMRVSGCGLHRAQTGRSASDAHRGQPGSQLPMARFVWQARQRAQPAKHGARPWQPSVAPSLPLSSRRNTLC